MNLGVEKFGTVGVLMGGYSSEREISLKSGEAVYEALAASGCKAVAIDITEKDNARIMDQIRRHHIDIAFIALHGRFGEDGGIQSILEQLSIFYTGSGIEASRIACDKGLTQALLKKNGINVAPFLILSEGQKEPLLLIQKTFGSFPVVVKPTSEGSSIGVNIVQQAGRLEEALELAWSYGDSAIVEQFIEGREMTVGIFNGEPLDVIEVCPHKSFFDFEAKYKTGLTDYKIPAEIPEDLSKLLRQTALKAYQTLGCRHLWRVDFIVDQTQKPFLLEINTIPGFTSTSLLPKAAKLKGISFNELCLKLVQLAYGQKKEFSKTGI